MYLKVYEEVTGGAGPRHQIRHQRGSLRGRPKTAAAVGMTSAAASIWLMLIGALSLYRELYINIQMCEVSVCTHKVQ